MSRGDIHKHIDPLDRKIIASSGIDISEAERSASFLQQDGKVSLSKSFSESVDILDIHEALERLPEARKFYGEAFRQAGTDFPHETEGGYCIRVRKGARVEFPVQACMFLKSRGFRQKVHNLVIVEEGAQLYVITGCSASDSAGEGFHLGISEFFLAKNSFLNFTMVHSWRQDVSVRPISVSVLDEGATLVSNYIALKPVREIVMYPTALLQGAGARASFNSLILSHPGSLYDVGGRAVLLAPNTRSEIVSRTVSVGGKIYARGHIKAQAPGCSGHLECRGLILSERGFIYAIPEMETDFRDVDLSHEAAIGRISKDEIEYLCARGMSRERAQSVIVRGFMDIDILGLPDALKQEMNRLEEETLSAQF